MKKTLTILAILLSAYCYSQDTVVTKQTIILNGDTDIVYTIVTPSTAKVSIKELQAQKAGLSAEKAIYLGYIQSCNDRINRINEKIARLKAQAK